MSILKLSILEPLSYTISNLFTLNILFGEKRTKITMTVFGAIVNTRNIPETYTILNKSLPQIFLSKCFNDDKLTFAKEVQCTEIGHLFEHILLEYLCDYKFSKGFKDVVFTGVTSWNWKRDPYGTFHIRINASHDDIDIFQKALKKTISLMSLIMNNNEALQMPQILHPNLFPETPQPQRLSI